MSTRWPTVLVGDVPARVTSRSSRRLSIIAPAGVSGSRLPVVVDGEPVGALSIGEPWVVGVHQVDGPLLGRDGYVYATCSGTREQEGSVSLFRARRDGPREVFAAGIRNPTSLAEGPDGAVYVSSRFEGLVYRVDGDGRPEVYAKDLGIPCGLAWGRDGALYVGDRSGRILRVIDGAVTTFAELPGSVAAFHLAMGPNGSLHVAAPTLAPNDGLYVIESSGRMGRTAAWFGRPQGLAFDPGGVLHVADSLAGSAAIYRVSGASQPEAIVSGTGIVGMAFGPTGELAVATTGSVYFFPSQ